ncbi:MAG: 4-(cytidine 5'-diphospho)-2-C-methyl-D-erythritol kinase [Rubrobacteraceae bacterium]
MGDLIRLQAFAKLNYALDVLSLRTDGYHEIRTVMQSISLADEVEVERAESGFDLTVEPAGTDVGPTRENTTHGAWRALREATGEELPVRVRLNKKVPSGAGLGGGSADAAAVLVALNEMFGLGLDDERLREVGLRVGADVPFCIAGGTALGEGIGEELTPLPATPDHRLVVTRPAEAANTAEVYRAYDGRPGQKVFHASAVRNAIQAGDLAALGAGVGNALSPVTREMVLAVRELETALLEAGALGASMSGTGTAVYGIFPDENAAANAIRAVDAPFAGVFAPVDRGVEILT